MKCLLLATCLGVCVSSAPLFAQGLPQPLARFQFDGSAKNFEGDESKFLFKGAPQFKDQAEASS